MSDTDLLNELEFNATPGMKWICRCSTIGRGLRLHQDPQMGKYDTPREAIRAYFESKKESA